VRLKELFDGTVLALRFGHQISVDCDFFRTFYTHLKPHKKLMNTPFLQPKLAKLPLGLSWMRRLPWPHKLGLLNSIWGSTLTKHGVTWVKTTGGLIWKLDLANSTHRWLVYGDYQGPSLRRWAIRHLSSSPTLLLSGANIGQMVAALHPWLNFGTILAFEPDREAQAWLKECHTVNPSIPLRLLDKGLGSEPGTIPWLHADWNHSHGSQSRVDPSGSDSIQVVRLDDEVPSQQLSQIDLWILDVEDYELEVLEGATGLLKKGVISALFMEVSQSARSMQAVTLLRNCGYQPFVINNRGKTLPASEAPEHGDWLFLPVCCTT
jgi:FkbM family methyltransferase